MSGRVGASPVHRGRVTQVQVLGARTLLWVEAIDVAAGYRLGPLPVLEGTGAPWAVGDSVVLAELTPTSEGYVVLGRIAG